MQNNLYLDDSYCAALDSKILEMRNIKGNTAIALENNIFYPGGGGQPQDKGTISIGENEFAVENTRKMDGLVYLLVKGKIEVDPSISVGQTIDWQRRYTYMKCHSAAHVLMGAIRRCINNYVPQGIDIQEDKPQGIVTFGGDWDGQTSQVEKIFNMSNEIINKDLGITPHVFDCLEDAISNYQSIYRGPTSLSGKVRMIIIEDWDANPCGGTHVKRTSEIGFLRYAEHTQNTISFTIQQ